ncbi:hypothetical protein GAB14E_3987 [Colwellia psychrerythraea]|uniref:TPR domain protein n=2 Tax=Colwellia psychrerythraea TaxID=28229 RepID=A0A099KF56_COLPS|nr:hypothetical protein GAB14E_3987 [Colwellia psychrerythraea]
MKAITSIFVIMLRLLTIFIILFVTHAASAEFSSEVLLEKLAEAKDYLGVQPSNSSKILKKYLNEIDQLSINNQLTWHQNLLRASISLNDLKQVESTVRLMLAYPELETETDKFVSLLSSLGIFLRRSGYPQESIWLFDCGLNQGIKNYKQKISLLISKATSLKYLKKYSQAKATFAHALQLAKQHNDEIFIGSIYNSLGNMAIIEEEYILAKEYLINALQVSQKISRRTGQIIAGLQLLMLSILDNDLILYDKLHYRISRLTLMSDSETRHAYLFWIEKAHQVSKGKELSAEEQEELVVKLYFIKIVSVNLHNQLVEKLAKPMGIKILPIVKEYSQYKGDLLNHIHQCKLSK